MEITLSIKAPELAEAIHALAKALEINTQGALSAKNALATTITVLADAIEDSSKNEEVAETAGVNKVIDVTELRAAAKEKGGTAEGKKAIKALLTEYECKSISDVPEARRATFLEKLKAI